MPQPPVTTPQPPVTTRIVVPAGHSMVSLLGSGDTLLRVVEHLVASDVHVRGNEITLTGTPADNALAAALVEQLLLLLDRGEVLTADAVERSYAMLAQEGDDRPAEVLTLNILSNRGRTIRPKTVNQKRYVEAIDRHTVVFGIGPAGTGKTYLAMAKAVQALQAKQVNRLILTRPAVEAGEKLGFLPGTLYDKIDPYLRPLYDALHDMLDPDSIPRLMAAGTIEVAPLAYMRGRSQAVDTPVLTPQGYRPIGELEVGDLVYGSDGTPAPVLGVYPQGRREVFRVRTQDGASTLACAEHLWSVRTRYDAAHGRPARVLQTQDMREDLRHAHHRNYELPMVQPVVFPAVEVPLDPYALGLLLGGGSGPDSSPGTPADLDPVAAVPGPVRPRGGDDARVRRAPAPGTAVADPVVTASGELRPAGRRAPATRVPAQYLHNSVQVRLSVLQGLLDSDAGPVPQAGRTCRVQFRTTSPGLRDDVVWLVRSLGGTATTGTRRAAGRRPGRADRRDLHRRQGAYTLDIRLPEGMAPFRLAGKQAVYDTTGGGRPARFVDSIEPAGEAECVCISVGAQDSLYVTEDFLVTHNTLNDAFILLDEAQNTSAEQMKMFLTRLGFGSKIVVTGDVTQVDLPSGTTSGLRVVRDILDEVEDVHFAELSSADVVRHRLVGRIVDAYDSYDAEQAARTQSRPGPRRRPS